MICIAKSVLFLTVNLVSCEMSLFDLLLHYETSKLVRAKVAEKPNITCD